MTPAALYRRLTLRTRITISFVLLMAGAMGFIVLAEQVDYDQVRAAVIARTQNSAVHKLQAALARGERTALPLGSQLYDHDSVPMVLRQYGLGYHGEAAPNEWHLRVFDSGGQRYYLLQDAAPYGYLEYLINAFAALVISICVLGAFLIGRKVASHVIAPITQLADAVQSGRKPFPARTHATRSAFWPAPLPGIVMNWSVSCTASNASAAMPAMSCVRRWPSSAVLRKPLPASFLLTATWFPARSASCVPPRRCSASCPACCCSHVPPAQSRAARWLCVR